MHFAFGFDLKKINQEAVDRAVCSQTAPGRQPRLAYACSTGCIPHFAKIESWLTQGGRDLGDCYHSGW